MAITHNHKVRPTVYNANTQQEQLATAAVDIICAWLHFPVTLNAIAQWMFIPTIRKAID